MNNSNSTPMNAPLKTWEEASAENNTINPLRDGPNVSYNGRSPKFGKVVLILSLIVSIAIIAASITAGALMMPYSDNLTGPAISTPPQVAIAGFVLFGNFLLGGLFGFVLLVLAVIAIIRNAGRNYGIVSLVSLIVAPIVGTISFAILVS